MDINYRSPAQQTADALTIAFNHLNAELFDHRLPECYVHPQRKRGAHGYFWASQWRDRAGEVEMHEIALNPDTMGRTVPEVLSTLAHEMTHLEQHEYGKPGKGGHHNAEWAGLMDRIGLTPTATGEPGGPRTGRKMTHWIDPEGPFAKSVERLMATGYDLPWHAIEAISAGKATKKRDLSKVPHSCPECQQRAWAKLGARLMCGDCEVSMLPPDDVEDEG